MALWRSGSFRKKNSTGCSCCPDVMSLRTNAPNLRQQRPRVNRTSQQEQKAGDRSDSTASCLLLSEQVISITLTSLRILCVLCVSAVSGQFSKHSTYGRLDTTLTMFP